jgi:hypothetical protein
MAFAALVSNFSECASLRHINTSPRFTLCGRFGTLLLLFGGSKTAMNGKSVAAIVGVGGLLVLGVATGAQAFMVRATAGAKCTMTRDDVLVDEFVMPGDGDWISAHQPKSPPDNRRPLIFTCSKAGFKTKTVTVWAQPDYGWTPGASICNPPRSMTKEQQETYCLNDDGVRNFIFIDPKNPPMEYYPRIELEREDTK